MAEAWAKETAMVKVMETVTGMAMVKVMETVTGMVTVKARVMAKETAMGKVLAVSAV